MKYLPISLPPVAVNILLSTAPPSSSAIVMISSIFFRLVTRENEDIASVGYIVNREFFINMSTISTLVLYISLMNIEQLTLSIFNSTGVRLNCNFLAVVITLRRCSAINA
uniref:Uncharacterized protein n=1 Tax=Drosophila-associated filamentous virus TaxID=2743186 RepID=A0A6M9U0U5_9VIRU|nr:putative protein 8 [Drosophila-associated filamentous virus]